MGEPSDDLQATETAVGESTTQPTADTSVRRQLLGRYEIESVLGVGGMGVVYAAFDPELERRVALKVLPDAKRGQAARERLLREARAMARLTDPNVVRVYEVDSVDGHDFVAMELVDGGNLAEWLKAEPRAATDVIDKFVAAGRGLIAAHAAGVVHRDFKPHNVLVAKDGRILVTDFGLARGIEPSADDGGHISEPPSRATPLPEITATGSVVGTPAYMAPEQRDGGTVGPAADQFSFCVALWEALTGTRPYHGNAEEVNAALKRGTAGLDASKLPRRLRVPLLRGLEADPAKRWPTMKALLVQLVPRARRWLVPALIGGAAVLSLGAIALVLGMRDSTPPCTPSLLDPDVVWPAGSSAKLIANDKRGVARLLDRDIASWKATRAKACKAEPKQREATLACLDGVLARFNAHVRAAQDANSSDLDPEDFIEPTVCSLATPPRLPRTVAAEYRDVVTAIMRERVMHGSFGAENLADLDARAKQEPCARALAAFMRAATMSQRDPQKHSEALREAELQADRCGDDHALATILLYGVSREVETDALDAGPRTKQAETVLARIPTSDLQAKAEVMRMYAASQAKQLDQAIAHGQTAIAKLDERGCIDCSTRVALNVVNYYLERPGPADVAAINTLFAQQRAKILEAVGADSPQMRILEARRAGWVWQQGDLAEAHRILDAASHPKPIPKARRIKVVVVDLEGHPVSGAKVIAGSQLFGDSLHPGFAVAADAYVRSGVTNERGELDMPEVENEGLVIAQLGDRRSAPIAIGDTVKLVLEPTSRLVGKVTLGGIESTTLVVAAYPDDDTFTKLRYYTMVPVHSDGGFELGGVLRRELRVAVAGSAYAGNASKVLTVKVDRPVIEGLELSLAATRRVVHVLVRSTVRMPVPRAMVSVLAGAVASTNFKEFAKRTDTVVQLDARRIDFAKLPAEVKAIARRDDLYVQLDRVPEGVASACAMGWPGPDQIDEELSKKAEAHYEQIEVRCVPIAADSNVVVVEVPPFPRFD